ncbi:MAG: NAD-dependent epimerase/dehydratase family protein [Desulfovibrionaceae bacterium]
MAKYNKILVTGAGAVLGHGFKAIQGEYPDVEFVFLASKDCDLRDPDKTMEVFAAHKPDAIIHLAAVSGGIGLSIKHPASLLRDNTLMIFSVLEAVRKLGIGKIIMTLTTGMYPTNAPLPLNEDNIHDGYPHGSNYGSSFAKRLCDPAIRSYREEYGVNAIGLAPSGIFGPHDNFNFDDAPMLPALIRRFYENRNTDENVVIWGDGTPLREYTFSQDLARIYMWALENYDEAQVLNVGTTEEHAIKDIAYMIADLTGVDRSRIAFDTTKPKGVFRKNTDNARFMALSNHDYVPFREGLEKTIAWFADAYENRPETIRLYSKAKAD